MAMVLSVYKSSVTICAKLTVNAPQRGPLRAASRGARQYSGASFRISERMVQFKQSFSSTLNEKRRKCIAGPQHFVRGAAAVVVCQAALKESATGVEFPEKMRSLTCVGAGVREKKVAFLNVKVYALACYADAAGAKKSVAAGESLLAGAFDKAIAIQLVRDVDSGTFFEALDDAVKPRLALIATNAATKENADGDFMSDVAEAAERAEEVAFDALEELGEFLLNMQKLTSGTQLVLRCADGKTLQVSSSFSGGDADLQLDSPELCEAMMDVFLGIDPISPAALAAFKAGASKL